MGGHLSFKYINVHVAGGGGGGGGGGLTVPHLLSRRESEHLKLTWQPVGVDAQSRRSYQKMGDLACGQPLLGLTKELALAQVMRDCSHFTL